MVIIVKGSYHDIKRKCKERKKAKKGFEVYKQEEEEAPKEAPSEGGDIS